MATILEETDALGADHPIEEVKDSRFDWKTGVNERQWYYSQYWIQSIFSGAGPSKTVYCVVKRRDNKLYYVSDCDDDDGVEDIGPFYSLEDAASVCVMKNYGNKT